MASWLWNITRRTTLTTERGRSASPTGTTSGFCSGIRTPSWLRRRDWAPDSRPQCCPSGWPASTATGGCSSTLTRTSWSHTPRRTGHLYRIHTCGMAAKLKHCVIQVQPVLLQQHGHQGEEGHHHPDRHQEHSQSEGQCWAQWWLWCYRGKSPGKGHTVKVSSVKL